MIARVCHAFSNNSTPHNTRKQMQSQVILDGGCLIGRVAARGEGVFGVFAVPVVRCERSLGAMSLTANHFFYFLFLESFDSCINSSAVYSSLPVKQ